MRSVLLLVVCLFLAVFPGFAQSDRGTITGTITDPAGAVVAGAMIEVRNVETGAQYQVGSSATGNYVVQVPTGAYDLSVTVPGFKKYVRQRLAVPVEQTLRIDVSLEVGSNTESVTVSEAAPLLKTESGELAHNITSESLNNLPVLGIGAASVGATGIRSPYSVMNLIPGAEWLAGQYHPPQRTGGKLRRLARGGTRRDSVPLVWGKPPKPSPAWRRSRRWPSRQAISRRNSDKPAAVFLTSP